MAVTKNLKRKAEAADKMFESLVREMHNSQNIRRGTDYHEKEEVPTWL